MDFSYGPLGPLQIWFDTWNFASLSDRIALVSVFGIGG